MAAHAPPQHRERISPVATGGVTKGECAGDRFDQRFPRPFMPRQKPRDSDTKRKNQDACSEPKYAVNQTICHSGVIENHS